MKHTSKLSFWKRSLCAVLIAALALTLGACGGKPATSSEPTSTAVTLTEGVIVGEGDTLFTLEVTDGDGNTVTATVKTDEKTVGAALLNLGIIEGEHGQYGLYVKKVNGITADYDTTGTYWSFYINGDYAMSGVDATDITEGATYALKVEKG